MSAWMIRPPHSPPKSCHSALNLSRSRPIHSYRKALTSNTALEKPFQHPGPIHQLQSDRAYQNGFSIRSSKTSESSSTQSGVFLGSTTRCPLGKYRFSASPSWRPKATAIRTTTTCSRSSWIVELQSTVKSLTYSKGIDMNDIKETSNQYEDLLSFFNSISIGLLYNLTPLFFSEENQQALDKLIGTAKVELIKLS